MSSSARARDLERAAVVALFFFSKKREKCEKNLDSVLHASLQEELTDEGLEGNHDSNHREMECQRSAPQSASTYHVWGENLEDLQKLHDQLMCERSARRTLSWENFRMSTVCLRKYRIVGTFPNSSTIRGSRRTAQEGQDEHEILGTAMACSAIGRSKRRKDHKHMWIGQKAEKSATEVWKQLTTLVSIGPCQVRRKGLTLIS